MFAAADKGQPFALATIAAAEGGPRPVGSQMVITENDQWGFLSGGCIEEDVALHGRAVLADGTPRWLLYGRGSPFIDMRLPCGGRLEVLVERIASDDESLTELRALTSSRTPAWWRSDGNRRRCRAADEGVEARSEGEAARLFEPRQRLLVVGTDPFALAMAALGQQLGWETFLAAPPGFDEEPPFGLRCDRRPIATIVEEVGLDRWTAVAVATHEIDRDEEMLVPALISDAHYVGVLGSRKRLPERIARLRGAGLTEQQLGRLKAPIGLDIGARAPWEVGIAVVGEIIASATGRLPTQAGE